MAEKNEEVVIITDDADDGALFSHGIDDGAVVAGVIHEKGHGKLAEQASQVWNRAKVGFEKGKLEHDGKGFHEVAEVNEVVVEGPTAAATTANPTAWERLATIPSTVAGVVGFRNTGYPRPTAALLVTEELVEVPKPRPIPDLFHDATEEVSGLVHAELALVKTEIKQKVKIIGPALIMILGAIVVLLFAIPFLLWSAVFGLVALGIHIAWAALIMFAVLLLVTALAFLAGFKKLKKLGNVKSLAGGSIKDDIHAIIEAFKGHKWADAQAALKEERL